MSGRANPFLNFLDFSGIRRQNRGISTRLAENGLFIEKTMYKKCIKNIEIIYSYYIFSILLTIFLLYCQTIWKWIKSKINYFTTRNIQSKTSKPFFSLERIIDTFSFWFPRAREYGFTADSLYHSKEKVVAVLIPMPIVKDGNFRLWLFTFTNVGRITPRLRDIILSEIYDMPFRVNLQLVERETHFIIAERIRGKHAPKIGRRSVFVVRSDYAWKVYEIVARSIEGFVHSFRKNVRYGEDLLELCEDMEKFAEIMRSVAEKLKSEIERETTTQPSPTHHPDEHEKVREEVRNHLNLLSEAEVIR